MKILCGTVHSARMLWETVMDNPIQVSMLGWCSDFANRFAEKWEDKDELPYTSDVWSSR